VKILEIEPRSWPMVFLTFIVASLTCIAIITMLMSLLGRLVKTGGYVEHLEMHSLDPEEFLWANGVTPTSVADIKEYFDMKKIVPAAMHGRMMELLKEYIVVGGMPRVVDDCVDKRLIEPHGFYLLGHRSAARRYYYQCRRSGFCTESNGTYK